MSTATVVFFVISLGTFIILLALATALFLRSKSAAPAPSGFTGQSGADTAKRVYTCDAEVAILDSMVQITNLEEKPMRLEASSAGQGMELVASDQWVQKLGEGTNTYRIFASSDDSQFDQLALEIKVTAAEVALKPILKSESTHVQIWKLKPVLLSSQNHLVERQVFSGRLQKTINFDRAAGKFYKIQVTTDGNRGKTRQHGLQSRSNVAASENHLLLTVRVEASLVQASNLTNRRMEVTVSQASDQSTLKRKLSDEVQEMPLNGNFAFAIEPGKSAELKDLLCLKLTDHTLVIEPYTKFGTVPLICEVRCPSAGSSRSPGQAAALAAPQTVIVSGEVLSPLQLPRKSYCYILAFYMRVAAAVGPSSTSNNAEQTSYTLQ